MKCKLSYRRDTGIPMFIATLFTAAELWNQPRCPSTDEWIKKMWYVYTVEYYLVIKKNKIMSFAGKWMELEITILSEISQTQKVKYCMFFFICGLDLKNLNKNLRT
jgi:hypothetical protein